MDIFILTNTHFELKYEVTQPKLLCYLNPKPFIESGWTIQFLRETIVVWRFKLWNAYLYGTCQIFYDAYVNGEE